MDTTLTTFAQSVAKNTNDHLLQDFIHKLYSSIPEEELKALGEKPLYEAAVSSFELCKMRLPEERHIKISRLSQHGEWAVLHLIGNEIPFLVESISNELKLQNMEVKLIAHPVMTIKRDANGKLLQISSNGAEGAKESVMQFFIPNWFDDEYYTKLISRLKEITKCVALAVADWGSMKARITSGREYVAAGLEKDAIKKEYIYFLDWLVANNFILLGSFILKRNEHQKMHIVKGSELGICKDPLYKATPLFFDDQNNSTIFMAKSDSQSVVHRTDYMNCLFIKKFGAGNVCVEKLVFFGFFTSSTYYQSVRSIPYIRMKVDNIIEKYGQDEASYNTKELVSALEAFPRSDLFQMGEDVLYEMVTSIVSLSLLPKVKAFARLDQTKKFISFIIFLPKIYCSHHSIAIVARIVEQQLHGNIARRYMQVSDAPLARLQFLVKLHSKASLNYNISKIEELVLGAISVWQDEFFKALCAKYPRNEATAKHQKYKDAFDEHYTSHFAAQQAVHDIKLIENVLLEQHVKFSLYISAKSGKELVQLKIFSPNNPLLLSSTLPIIENMGFLAVDMLTFRAQVHDMGEGKDVFIDYFRLEPKNDNFLSLYETSKKEIEITLEKIWQGFIEDDQFNTLISYTDIKWREVQMIRAYAKYLKQTNFIYDAGAIATALSNNSHITGKLIKLFNHKFDPSLQKNSHHELKQIEATILNDLLSVPSLTEDRVIRTYLQVIMATKRTNFFQKNAQGELKDYISFKIASGELLNIPLPKPFREIWVYSPRFEGIHLRGGKVARGGLRWSDRHEDFRTEVLGLMKAQMTKNSVIVPVGSKGGFVVKKVTPAAGRDIFFEEGINCYKQFLSGVLDITDNIIDQRVVHPQEVVRYDEDDPYLVVAADKGTSTFSDYANSVSAEHNFWLSDAFASGGSAGYDHKKIAITARGAWISVKQHFMELGTDIAKQPFTVIGIGDMSGDVFGNGMLLCEQLKLVGAFNHSHIFLDPSPDIAASFAERKRLFELPRSQWTDYDTKIISKGGGIFLRSTKSIAISAEAQQVLGIKDEAMAPDDLINAMLKAPVDLIWNGGIGTYIKATVETHEMIGDKSNDCLRVNGNELRCKVIAEGGNLGCTQLGRIEYARNGGKSNPDFIDNSAAVDCSDHEVNIKIGFSTLMRKKALTYEARNKLLVDMTDEVVKLVLTDNYKQTQLLSMEEIKGENRLDEHIWLIRYLESREELNGKIEHLPNEEEALKIRAEFGKLSRPEIAVLVAYSKISASKAISEYDFTKDNHLLQSFITYFPRLIQDIYREAFLEHKLKNEIIQTVLVNDFVNTLGCCLFHQLLNEGFKPDNIIKAFVVVRDSLNIQAVWQQIERLDTQISFAAQAALFSEVQQIMERSIIWLLNHHTMIEDVGQLVQLYQKGIIELKRLHQEEKIHPEWLANTIEMSKQALSIYEMPEEILNAVLALEVLNHAFSITYITSKANCDISSAAAKYFILSEKLHLYWILEYGQNVVPKEYADALALRSVIEEICNTHLRLTVGQLKNGKPSAMGDSAPLSELYDAHKIAKYYATIDDLKKMPSDSFLSMLIIASKQLKSLLAD